MLAAQSHLAVPQIRCRRVVGGHGRASNDLETVGDPAKFEALRALRRREMLFAIDQQPYLQGYLPILFLAQHKLYGLIPAAGTVVPTGPNFVTPANAALVQQLTAAGIR